jgi:hypothetical protein
VDGDPFNPLSDPRHAAAHAFGPAGAAKAETQSGIARQFGGKQIRAARGDDYLYYITTVQKGMDRAGDYGLAIQLFKKLIAIRAKPR